MRRVWLALIPLGLLAGVASCSYLSSRHAEIEREREAAYAVAEAAARAVSVLPPGTEDAWVAYVDRRISATMKRRGQIIDVAGIVDSTDEFKLDHKVSAIISYNTSYQILCFSLRGYFWPLRSDGIRIAFGQGTGAVRVEIFDNSAEPEPQLGVSAYSIAAKNLTATLCRRIADDVSAIMARGDAP